MPERLNFVDGNWIPSESGDTFEVQNPAQTSETVSTYQLSSKTEANTAIDAAAAARDSWMNTPAPERGTVLRNTATLLDERRDELTELLVREEGKAPSEAGGEVGRAVDIFYYYAEKTRDLGGVRKQASGVETDLYTVQKPVGVVGLITPWNYPIAIPAWKLAPALATGNTAVLKPAPEAPGVARELVAALDEAGLPDGVVNFVTGEAPPGEALVSHDSVDAISFTGSAEVGTQVYRDATDTGKRVQTEMGGKNPTVVMASADIDHAIDIVTSGAFGVTGQACTATSRAIVHEDVYDEFLDAIVAQTEAIEVGPGFDSADMGPQINEGELRRTLDYIEVGKTEGAQLVTGGNRLNVDDGYFVEPTVFADVTPEMRIAQEEIFGPVLAVMSVSNYAEAVAVANDVNYGLAASIVTENHREAKCFVDDVEAGIVKLNQKTTGLELHVPFGGFKQSSSETWREQGDAGLDFYTISKTVYDRY